MRYKVGDKVKVRDWDDMAKEYEEVAGGLAKPSENDFDFCSKMIQYCGMTVTIQTICNDSPTMPHYGIYEDEGKWAWNDYMFVSESSTESNNSTDIDNKGTSLAAEHYKKAAMQPVEFCQRILSKEEFIGALKFNIIKYLARAEYKGKEDEDKTKALQYAYWLELAKKDIIINPERDSVPADFIYHGL